MSDSPWIIDTSEENFVADVIDRSATTTVLVDFWAPWCGPCMRLAPVLHKLAAEANGAFTLVKANTDEVPQAAGSFNVASIPSVFALRDKQIVDYFVGPKTETELRQWIAGVLPSPAQSLAKEAEGLLEIDPAAAEAKFRAALADSPDETAWQEGLAAALVKLDRHDEAAELLAALERRELLSGRGEQVLAAIKLKRQAGSVGGVGACRAAVAAAPQDFVKRLDLAEALLAGGEFKEAFELCLDVLRRDFGSLRERAKTLMVEGFQVLGPAAELVVEYRRKLSASLY